MTLATLQRDMRAWLETGSDVVAARFDATAASGLKVYQNNYRAQLVACLEASFPQTLAWLGGEAFHQAVVAHIERIAPSSWTLDAYPLGFPRTLRSLYPDDAEVAELAMLEAALDEAFVGPDADPVAADTLQAIDWDRAQVTFVPTLELCTLTTNAPAIRTALLAGETPPGAQNILDDSALLVWRHAMVSRFRPVEALERDAIVLMQSGMRFARLCEVLVDRCGEAAGIALAGRYLGQWLADGLVAAVTEGTEPCEGVAAGGKTLQRTCG